MSQPSCCGIRSVVDGIERQRDDESANGMVSRHPCRPITTGVSTAGAADGRHRCGVLGLPRRSALPMEEMTHPLSKRLAVANSNSENSANIPKRIDDITGRLVARL